jgi:hypothetical protein
MLVTILLVMVAVGVLAALASVVMAWASNRSALWNMALGGVLALAVLAGALVIAFLLTRAAYPN